MSLKIESLELQNIDFSHDGDSRIFRKFNVTWPQRQTIFVRGESGAGKSTLLQILAGLQIPQGGRYLINGVDVLDLTFEEFLEYRMRIGYSFDFGGLIHNRTLLENLVLPIQYHRLLPPQLAQERAMEYVNALKIDRYCHLRPAMAPQGANKAISLLRAVIHHPDVLLLDEPTMGIPDETLGSFFDLVHLLQQMGLVQQIIIASSEERVTQFLPGLEALLEQGDLHWGEYSSLGWAS